MTGTTNLGTAVADIPGQNLAYSIQLPYTQPPDQLNLRARIAYNMLAILATRALAAQGHDAGTIYNPQPVSGTGEDGSPIHSYEFFDGDLTTPLFRVSHRSDQPDHQIRVNGRVSLAMIGEVLGVIQNEEPTTI